MDPQLANLPSQRTSAFRFYFVHGPQAAEDPQATLASRLAYSRLFTVFAACRQFFWQSLRPIT